MSQNGSDLVRFPMEGGFLFQELYAVMKMLFFCVSRMTANKLFTMIPICMSPQIGPLVSFLTQPKCVKKLSARRGLVAT